MSVLVNVFLLVAAYRLCYALETPRAAAVLGVLTGFLTGAVLIVFGGGRARDLLIAAPVGMAVLGFSFWLCSRRLGIVFTALNLGASSLAALVLPILVLAQLEK